MLMDYGDFGDSPPITLKPVPRLRGVDIYHLNTIVGGYMTTKDMTEWRENVKD